MLGKNAGFSAVAILTLALGIVLLAAVAFAAAWPSARRAARTNPMETLRTE